MSDLLGILFLNFIEWELSPMIIGGKQSWVWWTLNVLTLGTLYMSMMLSLGAILLFLTRGENNDK